MPSPELRIIDKCHIYSSFALGTAKMTVNTPMAPAMGTMIRATEPLGIKTKVESNTIATIMPQAPAFCATVIQAPPHLRLQGLRKASLKRCKRCVSLTLKWFTPYLSSSIFCMASSIMSGVTIGSKRRMVLPSLETKNLPKFQRMASPWSKPVPVFW